MVKRSFTIALSLLLIFALLSACGQTPAETPTEAPSPTPTQPPAEKPSLAPTEEPSPEPTEEPTEEPSPEPTPDLSGPDVPAQETPATDDYFSDAAFLGNSLIVGFGAFSGLTTGDCYAETSMSVLGVGSLASQVAAQDYGKIYILLGINELGYDADAFKELYTGLIDTLQTGSPEATIYILSVTPLTKAKDTNGDIFTMARVNSFNERLYDLAGEKGCYFIDLGEALADAEGYLPPELSTDGVHLTQDGYHLWLDYLREHYIPDGVPGGETAAPASGPVTEPAPEPTQAVAPVNPAVPEGSDIVPEPPVLAGSRP